MPVWKSACSRRCHQGLCHEEPRPPRKMSRRHWRLTGPKRATRSTPVPWGGSEGSSRSARLFAASDTHMVEVSKSRPLMARQNLNCQLVKPHNNPETSKNLQTWARRCLQASCEMMWDGDIFSSSSIKGIKHIILISCLARLQECEACRAWVYQKSRFRKTSSNSQIKRPMHGKNIAQHHNHKLTLPEAISATFCFSSPMFIVIQKKFKVNMNIYNVLQQMPYPKFPPHLPLNLATSGAASIVLDPVMLFQMYLTWFRRNNQCAWTQVGKRIHAENLMKTGLVGCFSTAIARGPFSMLSAQMLWSHSDCVSPSNIASGLLRTANAAQLSDPCLATRLTGLCFAGWTTFGQLCQQRFSHFRKLEIFMKFDTRLARKYWKPRCHTADWKPSDSEFEHALNLWTLSGPSH